MIDSIVIEKLISGEALGEARKSLNNDSQGAEENSYEIEYSSVGIPHLKAKLNKKMYNNPTTQINSLYFLIFYCFIYY